MCWFVFFFSLVAYTSDFFFFFQAEDGIRDYKVTGVQTCALPILIHGITDNRATWAPFCKALREVAPEIPWISQDLRGHGGSSLPVLAPSNHITADGFRLADYAADAVDLLDAFGIDRAILVGHSLGGLIGQEVELSYPDRLQGLVMVATTTNSRDNPIFFRD